MCTICTIGKHAYQSIPLNDQTFMILSTCYGRPVLVRQEDASTVAYAANVMADIVRHENTEDYLAARDEEGVMQTNQLLHQAWGLGYVAGGCM
jgi:hypothetical protein